MRINIPWATLLTTATSDEFHPTGPWQEIPSDLALGTVNLRARMEVRAIGGTGMQVAAAVQTANDRRNPDAGTAAITAVASTGFADPNATPPTIALKQKRFIRPGYLIHVTSGTGGCRVAGAVELLRP